MSVTCRYITAVSAPLLLACSLSFGQGKFAKGYYIDHSGQKTECLIWNFDWAYSPANFVCKQDVSSAEVTKSVDDVAEFCVYGYPRYISAKVRIDRSSDNLDDNDISRQSEPQWKDERVFLRVLVTGDATLMSYEEPGFRRFFYQKSGSGIEQLVYKRYRIKDDGTFSYNDEYVTQLFSQINCQNASLREAQNTNYTRDHLTKWFIRHNHCADPTHRLDPTAALSENRLLLKAVAGGAVTSYTSGTATFYPELAGISYGSKFGAAFGLELEDVVPFYHRNWSVLLEPTFYTYTGTGVNSAGGAFRISYLSINGTVGLRRYFPVSPAAKIFLDAGVGMEIKQVKPMTGLGAGLSIGRLMVEGKYYFVKHVMDGTFDDTQSPRYSNAQLLVKYTIFN